MKYLNKVLFTVQQIYNTSWIKSAGLTVVILVKDFVLTIVMNSVSSFILFLSKIICSGLATLFFFLYLKFGAKDTSAWIIPAVLVFVMSYIISSLIINMYDNIIDIVFVCYQADNDVTANGSKRPLYITSDIGDMLTEYKEASAASRRVEGASDDDSASIAEEKPRRRRRKQAE